MTCSKVLCFFSWMFFSKGLASVINTPQSVLAKVGDKAFLNCQLLQSKNVLQVTWQKILPEGEKNLATYNRYFGQRMNPDFRGKMEFMDCGLQNCSIMIREVKDQDEGCYHCLFNTYPDGALTGRTCLQIYELHDPVLYIRESNSSEESSVSCSASGRPAPTITLTVTQQDVYFSHYNTVSVSNSSGTVTVTTTAVLSGSPRNHTQVGCAVRVLSGPQKLVFETIPDSKDMDPVEEDDNDVLFSVVLPVVTVLVALLMVLVTLAVVRAVQNRDWTHVGCLKQPRNTSTDQDPEAIKTPQRQNKDNDGVKTPSTEENDQHRRWTTPETCSKRNVPHQQDPLLKKKLFPT
ncbi:uncharacterized protein KZ484_019666 [Pholidichthys leucotaenia]